MLKTLEIKPEAAWAIPDTLGLLLKVLAASCTAPTTFPKLCAAPSAAAWKLDTAAFKFSAIPPKPGTIELWAIPPRPPPPKEGAPTAFVPALKLWVPPYLIILGTNLT